MKNSVFKLTSMKTGKDITFNLLGFTSIESKVYAVCSYDPENMKTKNDSKTAIFRIIYDKENKPEFILIEDLSTCASVMDSFYDNELK